MTHRVGKYPFFDTRLSVGYRRRCCIKKRVTGNLIELPNTICNLFVQPLMEMVGNRFRQPKQVTQSNMQPLMETVGNRFRQPKQVTQSNMQPLMETVGNRLWKR